MPADVTLGFCKTTTSTAGTSNYVLSTSNNTGPYRTPKQAVTDGSLSDGDIVRYSVFDSTQAGDAVFEIGFGIYTDATNTITRSAGNVIDSSNGPGSLVSWGASGTRDVILLAACALMDQTPTFLSGMQINGADLDVQNDVNIGTFLSDPAMALNVSGGIAILDGMTAPGTTSGFAKIYVDTSDGDLKIKFGDGTVKTIVTDT